MSIAEEWSRRSEEALSAANAIREITSIWAAFLMHQAVEFRLKGKWCGRGLQIPATHRLTRLVRGLDGGVADEVILACVQLSNVYYARYPDRRSDTIQLKESFGSVEVIFRWLEQESQK